jgi:hypothetical protein
VASATTKIDGARVGILIGPGNPSPRHPVSDRLVVPSREGRVRFLEAGRRVAADGHGLAGICGRNRVGHNRRADGQATGRRLLIMMRSPFENAARANSSDPTQPSGWGIACVAAHVRNGVLTTG